MSYSITEKYLNSVEEIVDILKKCGLKVQKGDVEYYHDDDAEISIVCFPIADKKLNDCVSFLAEQIQQIDPLCKNDIDQSLESMIKSLGHEFHLKANSYDGNFFSFVSYVKLGTFERVYTIENNEFDEKPKDEGGHEYLLRVHVLIIDPKNFDFR